MKLCDTTIQHSYVGQAMNSFKNLHRQASELILEVCQNSYTTEVSVYHLRKAIQLEREARSKAINRKMVVLTTSFIHACENLIDMLESLDNEA
jgi:phosphopantetheine adenylyltransferase